MKKILAEFISYIFHPLLMTTWLMMSLAFLSPEALGIEILDHSGKWILTGIFVVLTFALPMASIIIMKVTSGISSITLENRSERSFPFIFTTIYYGVSSYFFMNQYLISDVISSIMISVFVTILAVTLITFYWKISAHSAASWGIVGILIALNIISAGWTLVITLIFGIIFAGTVCSSRLVLKVHSFSQVLWGGILGVTICLSTLLMLN